MADPADSNAATGRTTPVLGVQPFTNPAYARDYYRRLPAELRDKVDEDTYVRVALRTGEDHLQHAAENDAIEARRIRRARDPAFDRAERERERRSLADLHARMRIEAARRPSELVYDGRSLTWRSSTPVPAPRTAPRARGAGRPAASRSARGDSGDSDSDSSDSDGDEPALGGLEVVLRARGPPRRPSVVPRPRARSRAGALKQPRRGVSAPAQENVLITQTNIIPKSPVSRNGDRPHSPNPYTTPALLASVEQLRADLVALAAGIGQVLGHVDEAAEFLDYRVEQARVRERRRNRRGQRRAAR